MQFSLTRFQAGQEEYAALKDQYMMTGEGFILAYSIVDSPTFEEVQQLRNQIIKIKNNPRVPMILLGNKLDLVTKEPTRRAVSQATAQQLASSWGVPFFESSAKGMSFFFLTASSYVLVEPPV
jgi:small GTP-binding protein